LLPGRNAFAHPYQAIHLPKSVTQQPLEQDRVLLSTPPNLFFRDPSLADPERRFAHLDLAQRWLRLAAQIDKIDPAAQCAAPLVPLQGGHRQNQGGA
jgi:hypothetical protein